MKVKKKILGIIVILCILIVCICVFLYLKKDKKELEKPTEFPENTPVEDNINTLEPSIEKPDSGKENENIIQDSNNNHPESTKPDIPDNNSNNANTTDNIDNKDNISIENPETPSISKPNPEPKPPVVELTQQEKENDEKRNQIQTTYGLTIIYGNEPMSVPGRELVRMTDAETIHKNLDILDKQLQKYPIGFFKSFEKEGMPLTILLVEGVVGRDIAGAADTQDATKPKLILTNRNFEEVIHHEMMHCIDLYLNIMMYRDGIDPFTEYEQYNPDDFEYGNIAYVEKETGNPHFWFDYAKTNVSDDRAELFKAMMTVNSVLLKRGALKDKGTVISKQIKKYFQLKENTYWEKSIGISL